MEATGSHDACKMIDSAPPRKRYDTSTSKEFHRKSDILKIYSTYKGNLNFLSAALNTTQLEDGEANDASERK